MSIAHYSVFKKAIYKSVTHSASLLSPFRQSRCVKNCVLSATFYSNEQKMTLPCSYYVDYYNSAILKTTIITITYHTSFIVKKPFVKVLSKFCPIRNFLF